MFPRVIFVALALFCAVLPAQGTTFYVSTGGNNSYDGQAATYDGTHGPWATIDHGDDANLVGPGDIILVAGGTYTQGSVNGVHIVKHSGTAEAPITYKANGPGPVIIQNSGISSCAIRVQASYIVIDGFVVTGSQNGICLDEDPSSVDPNWVRTQGNVVKNCTIHDIAVPGSVPPATYAVAVGIKTHYCDAVSIHNNIVYSILGDDGFTHDHVGMGIAIMHSANSPTVYNNTIDDCGLSGIHIWGDESVSINPIIRNNIIANSHTYGITRSGAAPVADHNLFYNNIVGDYATGVDPGAGDMTGLDPAFTDAANHDYSLQPTSPAVDCGVDVGFTFQGNGPDRGAIESSDSYEGTTYFVAPGGDDYNDGLAATVGGGHGPWATIDNGDYNRKLRPGDTVEVQAGTYTYSSVSWGGVGMVWIENSSGTPLLPITYKANGSVIIDGASAGYPNDTVGGIRVSSAYTVIDGFEIKRVYRGIAIEKPGVAGGAVGNTIKNCKIHDVLYYTVPQSYQTPSGIYVDNWSDGTTVQNCVIYDVKGDGRRASPTYPDVYGAGIMHGTNLNCKYINNTLDNIADMALMVFSGDSANNPVLKNNIIYGAYIGAFNNASGSVFSNNMYYSCPTNYWWTNAVGANDYTDKDPLFVNRAAHDYHLQGTSYAIDTGADVGLSSVGAPDRGAFESTTGYTGVTYFVNKATGNDSYDGLSATEGGGHGPWASIDNGDVLVKLRPGDNVSVAAGTYTSSRAYGSTACLALLINCGGSAEHPITYLADTTNGPVILDGTTAGYPNADINGFRVAASGTVIDGFEIKNCFTGVYVHKSGAGGEAVDNTIKNCKIHDILWFTTPSSYKTPAGILVDNWSNGTTVQNCVIYDVKGDGRNANPTYPDVYGAGIMHGTNLNCKYINNTLDNIADMALMVFSSDSANNPVLKNNIIYGAYIGAFNNASGSVFSNNMYYSCPTNYWWTNAVGTNDYTDKDPLFVNRATHDYHLQGTSYAIDTGADVGLSSVGAPDRGAFESTTGYTGVTYYVNNVTGNDSYDGLSATEGGGHGPWASIDNGDRIGKLRPNDTVEVQAGTYTGGSTGLNGLGVVCLDNCSGTALQPINYKANGSVIIDGASAGYPNTAVGGIRITTAYTVIDGFEVQHAYQGIAVQKPGAAGGAVGNTVKNCKVHDILYYTTPQSYQTPAGIFVENWSNGTTVQNCVIHDVKGDGRHASPTYTDVYGNGIMHGSNLNCKYINNTLENIADMAVMVFGSDPTNDPVVKNNLTYGAFVGAFNIGVPAAFSNNLYYGCGTNYFWPNATGANDITGSDPLFVNRVAHDYHLLSGSPAIDAGVDVGLVVEDGHPDIGAFEAAAQPPVDVAKISGLKSLDDGTVVNITSPKVVTADSSTFADGSCYIEEPDRASGIKVVRGAGVTASLILGHRITLTGTMGTDANGERFVTITAINSDTGGAEVSPVGTTNKTAVGSALSGILARAWGAVTFKSGSSFVYIEDGSLLSDGTGSYTGVRVILNGLTTALTRIPNTDQHVAVTGVAGLVKVGAVSIPVIRPRSDADISIY